MKNFKLALTLLIAINGPQQLMANNSSPVSPVVYAPVAVLAGLGVVLVAGWKLYGPFKDYLANYLAGKDLAESQANLINRIQSDLSTLTPSQVPQETLSLIQQSLDNGLIPKLDRLEINPDVILTLQNAIINTSEAYFNISPESANAITYEELIGIKDGQLGDSFDAFASNVNTINPKLVTKLQDPSLTISDALQAVKAEIQIAGNTPDLPQTGSDSPTDPATGTGSSVQTPAAGASFEALQSNITQSIANISKLTPTDLTNLRATITQQMATAQAELESAVTEEQRVAAQEKVDTATNNAKNFNDNKPTGSDVEDIPIE